MPQTKLKATAVPNGQTQPEDVAHRNSVTNHSPRRQFWWAILALTIAAVIRLAAARRDLAIDEIWSLWFVRHVTRNFVQIFALRHDNNHLLNTMILFGMGPNLAGICYRLPAVLASIGSVWLAGRIAIRQGGFPACVTAWVLVGSSYLLILYGSEARGYSYVILFAYLSWFCLLRTETSGRWIDATAFAVSACLGFLAHLTFLYCYAGFCVWTIWKWLRKPTWSLALAHVPPFAIAACLYLFFIRGMGIGGGPETSVISAIISTLSIIAGGPQFGDGALVAALLMTLLLGFGFVRLWQKDKATATCYVTIIILAPAAVLMMTGHSLIYPRYFLVPVAFALLLISHTIASWRHAGCIGRTGQVAIIGAYLVGNLWWTARLLDHGRGDYSQALAWIATQVQEGPATVSSDHDFRNGMIFEYYAARLWSSGSPLRYVAQQSVPQQGTDWLILHDFEGDPPFPEIVTDRAGNQYRLERTYRHHSLTGWNWWIYRRAKRINLPRKN